MGLVHRLAGAVATGALMSLFWPVAPQVALAAGVALASVAVLLSEGDGRRWLIAAGVTALAAAHAASARDAVLAPPLGVWFAAEERGSEPRAIEPVVVRGVIQEDAALSASGTVRFRLRVTHVDPGTGWVEAPGLVQALVQGQQARAATAAWTRGRRLEATVVLKWPPVARNPGGPDPMRQRLGRGYVLTATVKSAALVAVTRGRWWDEWGATVRRYVRHTVAQAFGEERRVSAAVLTAILIGDRAGLDRPLTERLIAAGTYHVVAISGGNVALVTLVAVLLLRHALRPARLVPAGALVAVVSYGWLVGDDPSVARAVTAAAIWLGAETLGVRPPPLRLFSLVVLVVVALDPLMVIKPGAWLSFGATLGILACAGRLVDWVIPRARAPGRPGARLTRLLAGLGAATIAAELVLLPVGAWTFSRVSMAGLLLNFVAVPAMALVQIAGVVLVMTAGWWPSMAAAAASAAHAAVLLLVGSAGLVDVLPGLAWRVPPPWPALMAVYYAALGVLLAHRGAVWLRRCAWSGAGACLVLIATGPALLLAQPPSGTLRVSFLDVGQGDAVVVQFPSGQVLVVDAGASGEGFDAGERVVTPALWALGARTVDWVVFTHADLDHIGGMATVVAEFAAREVWEGIPVLEAAERVALRDLAGRRRLVWRQLRRGERWAAGGAEVTVLHPPEPDWERPRVRNDDSVVLRIRYGVLEVLLTGDIGQAMERTLGLERESRADVRVLKVAHHGSRTSTGADLVDAYRPWAAIVSAGRNNPFGHPAGEVIERLTAAGAAVVRTDRDGAVVVESDGSSVTLRTWNGRRWRVVVAPPP